MLKGFKGPIHTSSASLLSNLLCLPETSTLFQIGYILHQVLFIAMFGSRSTKPSSEPSPSSDGNLSGVSTIPFPSNSDIVPPGPQLNLHIKLQRGKVYIAMFAMSAMPSAKHFHWALAMATNERSGMVYHNTNQGGPYAFKANYHSHLLNSSSLLGLVEISSIIPLDRAMHQRLAERLNSVPVDNLTCRPWLWRAIRLAAEEGFLGIDADKDDIIRQIEEECVTVASRGQRRHVVYFKSRLYKD
ncbi:hypothetical protein I7I53_09369 [Histoplasma capsulatum var. duboisii H88]|uniref:Uncharacterized protein n=3 Tax=Ajellomyces capsulatus TaxID=5037 RepID=A0A8A1LAL2_AJEC8|nr:hypothetical protein I7I53_09369 [Histoplasma capsulatum var. duboisii H88]